MLPRQKEARVVTVCIKKEKSKPPAPARPEPELDENGNPKGQRLCGNCNKIDGHNARTCKKRQLAKQLLEAHEKMYGTTASPANVKICIKNLLARQDISQEEDEEILDTDEEEDYEDETDDEPEKSEGEETDVSEEEEAYTQKFSQPDVSEKQEAYNQSSPQINLESLNKKEGKRKCGLCKKEKAGHYATTCPQREELLKKQLAEQQNSNSDINKPKGKKLCHSCNKIEGHNSRTCERKKLEAQMREKLQADLRRSTRKR